MHERSADTHRKKAYNVMVISPYGARILSTAFTNEKPPLVYGGCDLP